MRKPSFRAGLAPLTYGARTVVEAKGWGCLEWSRCSVAGCIGNTARGPRKAAPLRADAHARR